MEYRPLGRKLYATGGNELAARLSGIQTDRLIALSLIVSGGIAAFAGVIFAANIGSGSLTAGPPFLLPAFAAAFLGATTIKPGRYNAWGTLFSVLLLAVGTTGLQLAGAANWVTDVFNGAALVLAVTFANLASREG
jgi:ribose transport system permease protein